MKTFTINFSDIGKQEYLRLDLGYRYFFEVQKNSIFDFPKIIKLKYVLELLNSKKITKGELEQKEKLIDLGNIERRFNNLVDVEEVDEIGSDKNILQEGDLIIPKLQPQMGNIFLNLNHERFVGSTELLEYKINNNFNPLFLYYLITSEKFLNSISKLESGKTHRRVNPNDLLKIKIPQIPKQTQDQIVSQIEPIEKEIKNLKSQIKDPKEIINEVFAREFGFDKNLYFEFGKGMSASTQQLNPRKLKVFDINFSKLSKSEIFRFSTRFHNPITQKLMEILENIKTLKVKNILKEDIHRGASPKYDNNGNIPVIKTTHLKNNYIEISEEELVNENFYNNTKRSQVEKNDVLIASTGKGSIGKIDIVDLDKKMVIDSHISLVRIDEEKYNPLFFTYFF